MLRVFLIAAAGLALSACAASPPPASLAGRWVDLTHTLDEQTIFWPTDGGFAHSENFHGHTAGGWFYSSYDITLPEHGGTHLDAPEHFAEGRHTVDQIPLANLIGPAAVIDVSQASLADRDYRFTREDILEWERRHGRLPPGAIVLFRTGYDRFWPDRERYMGTALRGEEGVAALRFPGLSEQAARLLAEERDIAAVGLDTPSLDYGQSQDFIVHRILLGENIPGFENVARLDLLPPRGAIVVALPAKIGGQRSPLADRRAGPGKLNGLPPAQARRMKPRRRKTEPGFRHRSHSRGRLTGDCDQAFSSTALVPSPSGMRASSFR